MTKNPSAAEYQDLLIAKFNLVNQLHTAFCSVNHPINGSLGVRDNHNLLNAKPGKLDNGRFHWLDSRGRAQTTPADALERHLDDLIVHLEVMCEHKHERRLLNHPVHDLHRRLPTFTKPKMIKNFLQHRLAAGTPDRSDSWMEEERFAPLAKRVLEEIRKMHAHRKLADANHKGMGR